jgi:tetratricopeptide (TPR) repeat protein
LTTAALVAAAAWASQSGSSEARYPFDARLVAAEAADRSLEVGIADAEVQRRLNELARRVARRPVESQTRVAYAALLLTVSRHNDELAAARFHAARAAELAPTTVAVVRAAAEVLAHAGELEAALALSRKMFGYDVEAAARLLGQLRALAEPSQVTAALPERPEVWWAWSWRVREQQGSTEADRWIEATHRRWPTFVPAWTFLAEWAARTEDWDRLALLLPPDRPLPPGAEHAVLWIYRARLHAARGSAEAARRDIAIGLAQAAATIEVRVGAGAALLQLGDWSAARDQWEQALHASARENVAVRRDLLERLARLEERQGDPSRARRRWQELLDLDHAP